MPAYEINPLRDPRWQELVENHSQASVFHDTSWLKSLQDAYGYEPVVISTCPPPDPLTNGLVFCRVKSWLTGWRCVSLPFSDHCDPLLEGREQWDELLLYMREMVDGAKWKYIELRPTELQPTQGSYYSRDTHYYLHRLNLQKSNQELFRSFHKDCVQRKIRRAERESLSYDEGNSEELLNKFYHLLVKTRKRHALPPQPLVWFQSLLANFGNRIKIRVASKGDMPVASILTLTHKQSMIYKYGCSDAEFNKFGGMAFLFWKAIEEATGLGLKDLDLGRTEMSNTGLITFKEHWGATRQSIDYWRYPYSPTPVKTPLKEKALRKIFALSTEYPLTMAGKLFYRHIG